MVQSFWYASQDSQTLDYIHEPKTPRLHILVREETRPVFRSWLKKMLGLNRHRLGRIRNSDGGGVERGLYREKLWKSVQWRSLFFHCQLGGTLKEGSKGLWWEILYVNLTGVSNAKVAYKTLFLSVSMKVFLGMISIWISKLSRKYCPHHCLRAVFYPQ